MYRPAQLDRFVREEALSLREGRLIALVYPEIMERIMLQVAEDASRPPFERYYALYMLGYLVEAGRPAAKAALFQLANAQDPVTAFRAIDVLYPYDRACEFRDLYMRRSSDGVQAGFTPLSFVADSSTSAFMQYLSSRPQDGSTTAFDIHFLAAENLGRYQTLMSPDWQVKLGNLLVKGEPVDDVSWALEAARRNSFQNLTDVLRQRLDICTNQMKSFDQDYRDKYNRSITPGSDFESLFQTKGQLESMPLYFDDMLLMQHELGGKLTDMERGRLRTFGYGCDPKERLKELLGAD